MIYEATHSELRKDNILKYLEINKFKRVIDLGGVQNPWARQYVTHYVDVWKSEDWAKKYPGVLDADVNKAIKFYGDMDDYEHWQFIMKDVEKNGKFDFAICTQTIEHLNNPRLSLIFLPMIANEGFVSVPNKYTELRRGVHCGDDGKERYGFTQHFRGFVPHKWICTVRNDSFFLFPKLNFIEYLTGLNWVEEDQGNIELSFRWKDVIPFQIISDKDLDFPNPGPACKLYREELQIGI